MGMECGRVKGERLCLVGAECTELRENIIWLIWMGNSGMEREPLKGTAAI